MGSVWGNNLKLALFGESHGECVGVVIDGFPAGFKIDLEYINKYLKRRAPGGKLKSSRQESDEAQILSGVKNNFTTGAPICAVIKNNDARPADYQEELVNPRPSHADYGAYIKYNNFADYRGGGHFSGRLTAPLVFAGALCADYLEREYDIKIAARIKKVGHLNECKADELYEFIEQVQAAGDSVGAVVECVILNVPAGLGEHMFASAEAFISSAVFGIPGVKGIEFGAGFSFAEMRGSEANDEFYYDNNGRVRTKTNNNGGILGGMTSGMPIIFSVAFKPTPSILIEQDTIDLREGTNIKFKIEGRHDACIALRAVPAVESAAAVAIMQIIK